MLRHVKDKVTIQDMASEKANMPDLVASCGRVITKVDE